MLGWNFRRVGEAVPRHGTVSQDQQITRIRRYGEALLLDSGDEPGVAIDDTVTFDSQGQLFRERTRFYRHDGAYLLQLTIDDDRPIHELFVRPVPTSDINSTSYPAWESAYHSLRWSRFSPEASGNLQPFVEQLERCFGELPTVE